ncbi:MAG: glycine zipper 2TM domain-containing protein [Lysobacteraceae bacterium]
MNKPLVVAIAAVLVGGVAFAAYQTNRAEYAEVVEKVPVTQMVQLFGEVTDVSPITETRSGPREVCEDRIVEYEVQQRDPNRITGTVAGAVVGGLVGNQVGGGSGRRLATVAGAAGGAYAGREIQGRQQAGNRQVEQRVERQCRTVTETREDVVGYNVSYTFEGESRRTRMDARPAERIPKGEREEIIGYEVTWQYRDRSDTVFMEEDPGSRLPVEDGRVIVAGQEPAPRG